MSTINIRPMQIHEAPICEEILRSLPAWFGIEEAIVHYRQDIEKMDSYVATIKGEFIGFITLAYHNPLSAEIQVMAVKKNYHRQGIGRSLVHVVQQKAFEKQVKFLQVKTLGPSHPDLNYQKTRHFYQAQGFSPLEETSLWGDANPCLIMIKYLGA